MSVETDEKIDLELSTDNYARRFASAAGRWLLEVQAAATLKMLEPWPEATILDVGGGHAQLVPFLAKAEYPVTVYSSEESGRRRIRDYVRAGECKFFCGELLNMPFEDKSFDVVIAYHMLSHLDRWQEFLIELTRVARKAVIVDFPTTRSLNGIFANLFWLKKKMEGNTRTFMNFNEQTIVSFMKFRGFGISSRYPKFFFPMVVHRVMNRPALSKMLESTMRNCRITEYAGSPLIACFANSNIKDQRSK